VSGGAGSGVRGSIWWGGGVGSGRRECLVGGDLVSGSGVSGGEGIWSADVCDGGGTRLFVGEKVVKYLCVVGLGSGHKRLTRCTIWLKGSFVT
jgi:hypothetical protein